MFIYPTVQFKKKSISSFLGLSAYYSKLIGTRLKHREVVFLAIVPKTIVSVDISHHIYVLVCFPLLKYYSLIQCQDPQMPWGNLMPNPWERQQGKNTPLMSGLSGKKEALLEIPVTLILISILFMIQFCPCLCGKYCLRYL